MECVAWYARTLVKLGSASGPLRLVSKNDDHAHGSEFGMQGYPNTRTIDEWTDKKDQLYPQSRVSVQHNKAVSSPIMRFLC